MIINIFRQSPLEIFKEISHQCCAARDVKLSRVLAGSLLVHFTYKVKHQTDEIVFQRFIIELIRHERSFLNVITQNWHGLLHHFEVVSTTDTAKNTTLFFLEWQFVK
jgi:hypothetical protein